MNILLMLSVSLFLFVAAAAVAAEAGERKKGPPASTAQIALFNAKNLSSTIYEGLGSMVWQSSANAAQLAAMNQIYNNETSFRYVRINHQVRKYPNGVLTNYSLSYQQYVTFWSTYGDKKMPAFYSPQIASSLKVVILGTIPSDFLVNNSAVGCTYCELNTNTNAITALAKFFIAGLAHFYSVNGIAPYEFEISNEPDEQYDGQYVTTSSFNLLLQQVGANLYLSGLSTMIVGAGVSHLDYYPDIGSRLSGDAYINAISYSNIHYIGRWNVHAWIWSESNGVPVVDIEGGQTAIAAYWPQWVSGAKSKNPTSGYIVTEFSESATIFHGVTYPAYNMYSNTTAASTAAFGARIYNNAITLMEMGVRASIYWQLMDQSWGSGGTSFISLNATFTNAYYAMYPLIQSPALIGAKLVGSNQGQTGTTVHAVTMLNGDVMVVMLANCDVNAHALNVTLSGMTSNLTPSVQSALRYGKTSPTASEYSTSVEEIQILLSPIPATTNYTFWVNMTSDSTLTVTINWI